METMALFTTAPDNGGLTLRIDVEGLDIGDDGADSCWVEAASVELFEMASDGSQQPYTPVGETWTGHRYDGREVMEIAARAYVNSVPGNVFHEVHPVLADFAAKVRQDVVCSAAGRDIPSAYYDFWRGCVCRLVYVTDANSYYACGDSLLMFDADGHLVSDNNFAEDGLYYSLELVANGEEEEIWCSPDIAEYRDEIMSGA